MKNLFYLKNITLTLALFLAFSSSAQISVDNTPPYDSPIFLIDSLLLGSGVVASNQQFQGDPIQIGYFNGTLSNLGLDSGIVMSTGDIGILVPNGGFGGFPVSNATDPDLLTVANSVPDLIGQNFVVTSVNDVVILEFDFVPTSSFLSFKYVFGSQEYGTYENTQFNDVFGFFISGPGITGPYSSPAGFPDGSINIATIPDSDPELPITISSVNADLNANLFINNNPGGGVIADVNGFTTVITAESEVQCGETYHIRLSIADGSDTGLSSYVFLDAGSFSSPELEVTNSLEVDSNKIYTDCGVDVVLTANFDVDGSFVWNTGSDNQSISVGPGSYWVAATDETGCSANSDTIVVYSQPIPEISFSTDSEFCSGDILLLESNVTDGTLPYTFYWNTGSDNENLNVLDGGQYVLTVIDSNGCTDTDTIDIIEYNVPQLSFGPEEIVICGGNAVEVSAFGAETYSWSPNIGLDNPNSQIVNMSSSASITYTLTGTDANGCFSVIEVPTTAANGFEIDVFTEPVSCLGYDNGTVSIIVGNGAITPVSYSIDGGETFNSYFVYENLPFGTYEVLVKDALDCALVQEVSVEASQEPIQVITGSQDALCNGESNGSVFIESVTGGNVGADGYNLNWFTSTNSNIISTDSSVSVPAGSYYLIVTDDNECEATDQVVVEEPNNLNLNIETSDVSCYGAQDGIINVNIMGGGNSPYEFNWTNYGGANTSSLFNLGAGQYQLEITDENDCLYYYEFTINSPSQPLSIQSTSSLASCYGVASGSALVVASGGSQPYFYNWSSGHVTPNVEELFSGDYSVVVTDASGCQLTDSVSVLENPEIFTNTSSTTNTCFGYSDGSASIIASGGTGNLSYLWSNQNQQNAVFGLSYGNYWVITEDDLGCKVIDTVLVDQPANLRVMLNSTNVLCNGDSTGQISSTIIGGTPFLNGSYTYSWLLQGQSVGFNSPNIFNLASSQLPYELIVTDYNNCTSNGFVFVAEPEELKIDTSELIPAYCENIATGSASVIAVGGYLNTNSEYQFSWNEGNQTSMLVDYVSGNYVAYVEDDNGCLDSMLIEIPLVTTFESEMDSTPLNCFEDNSGQAIVSIEGGFGPFIYNFNWPSGSEQYVMNTESFLKSTLPAGVTSVVVTDINGCSLTDQTMITQPNQLLFDVMKDNDESCSGDVSSCDGQITINISGGTGDYHYQWTDLNNNLIDSVTTANSSMLAFDLCSGFYQFEIADEKGCNAINSGNGLPIPVEIVSGYNVMSSIDLNSYNNNISCYGDTGASASVLNPNSLFNYSWYIDGDFFSTGLESDLTAGIVTLIANYGECNTISQELMIHQPSPTIVSAEIVDIVCNGASSGYVSVQAINEQGMQFNWSNGMQTNNLSSLFAGVYSLSVTNSDGCITNFDFEISEPLPIVVDASVTSVSCNNGDDGIVSIDISGGQEPYSIDWQGQDPLNISAGSYSVIITDANSCQFSTDFDVEEPSSVNAFFNVNSIPFNGSASGGTPPYTYEWLYFGNQDSFGSSFNPTQNGAYTLVATDDNGCQGVMTLDYNAASVGLDEEIENSFNIFPNPMKNFLTIEALSSSSEVEFTLVDSRGRVLMSKMFTNSLVVNRENLASGLYTINLKSNFKNQKTKLIIYE